MTTEWTVDIVKCAQCSLYTLNRVRMRKIRSSTHLTHKVSHTCTKCTVCNFHNFHPFSLSLSLRFRIFTGLTKKCYVNECVCMCKSLCSTGIQIYLLYFHSVVYLFDFTMEFVVLHRQVPSLFVCVRCGCLLALVNEFCI